MTDDESTTTEDGSIVDRRIMDKLDEEPEDTVFNVNEGDIGVIIGPPIVGLFIAGLLNIGILALPLMGAGAGIGFVTVYAAPGHQSAWEWLKHRFRTAKRPSSTSKAPPPLVDDQSAPKDEDDSPVSWLFSSDEVTQDFLNVERAWDGTDAIQRSDGAMEAFIEVSPDNMDFAQSGDWADLQKAGKEFANTELDFSLTFYVTTREYPVEEVVEQIDNRLADEEVQENPALRSLLEEYQEKRPQELRERGAQQLRYFIGVEVDQLEVYFRYRGEKTPLEKLTQLPVIGFLFNPIVIRSEKFSELPVIRSLFNPWGASRGSLDEEELREKMVEKLDERMRSVRTDFIQGCSGWSARRLSAAELFALNAEFWNSGLRDQDTIEWFLEEPSEISWKGQSVDIDGSQEGTDNWAALHQTAMAPVEIQWGTRTARISDEWTRTLVIAEYPDFPMDSYLNELFKLTDVDFDLTVDLRPRDQDRAREELKEVADDLQANTHLEEGADRDQLQDRATRARATYKAAKNGQRVFDQAMFITVRAESRQELEDAVPRLKNRLKESPANLDPRPAVCRQDLALQSAAPVGPTPIDRSVIVLGGAVGALFASPHDPTVLEKGGEEVGVHRETEDVIVVDPFARENGYAMFTVGDPGTGKSFGGKLNFTRAISQNDDRIGIILEPTGDWAGVVEALGGQHITVGGSRGLNPLEIRPTPPDVQRRMGEDASPFTEKLDGVLSFLGNYFSRRGVSLDDRHTTLEIGIRKAYSEKGITEDITTHANESPTIRDVLDIFEEIIEDPEAFVVRSEAEAEKLREDAIWLLDQLRPFEEGGRYANLGKSTEFDLRDENVIYLDLGQQEGSIDSGASLEMQLLISLVYERAKETSKEVVFTIDESHYVFKDTDNLKFLETVFRHHRHHDLSIRLITQTVDEFFRHPESEAILDQCAIKLFHQLDGMDEELAEEFRMNSAQMGFVQDATPGNEEEDMAEALLGIDGEWRGIKIQAMPAEKEVVDFDAEQSRSREGFPGMDDEEVDLGQEAAANGGSQVDPGEQNEENEGQKEAEEADD